MVARPRRLGQVPGAGAAVHRVDDHSRPVQGGRSRDDRGDAAESRTSWPCRNLATVYAIIINRKLAKAHATAEDPWAQEWMKANTAGSGAYMIESFKPGEQVDPDAQRGLEARPGEQVAVLQAGHHPDRAGARDARQPRRARRCRYRHRSAGERRPVALAKGKLKVVSTPQSNAFTLVSMNKQIAPFDNVKVRQAVAYALPYDDMFKAALFGRGAPLYGATGRMASRRAAPSRSRSRSRPTSPRPRNIWPKPACPTGFSTTFSFNVGQAATAEPMAALVKESLGKIGIKVEIQKLPDAQMSTQITRRSCRSSPRASSPGCPRPTTSTAISTPAISAGTTASINNPETGGDRAGRPLRDRQGQVRGRRQEAQRHPFQRAAADPALAAQPGRRDGALDRRLHLSVPPPGRLSRSQSEITVGMMAAFGATSSGRAGGSCPRCRRCSACWSSPSC